MSAQPNPQSPSAKPDPGSRASFELFEEHYFLNELWSDLASLYRERVGHASLADDAEERARLLLRLGRVQEEKVGDEDAAIASYRECVALSSEPRPALQRLRGLYKRRGSWATVLQIAELEIETTLDPVERAWLFQEMGDIWQQEFGDDEQAQLLHARARAETADSGPPAAQPATREGEPASVERARSLMGQAQSEQAVAVLRERLEVDPVDLEALDLLITTLDTAGRHSEMPAVLEQRAAHATDGPTRATILARLGHLHEDSLDGPDAARVAYERAMGSDPTSEDAGVALARIYRLRESWDALRMLLQARIAQTPPEHQVGLLCELGDLHTHQLEDPVAAAEAYGRALAIDPTHERARAALEKPSAPSEAPPTPAASEPTACESASVADALLERLAALEAEGAGTSPNAIRLRLRLADLAVQDGDDVARAIDLLAPCLKDAEALPEVARALRRLYERTGDHPALVVLAQKSAEASQDPRERVEWLRAAATAAREDGDVETVVQLLERLLEEHPGDPEAEDGLLELHRARGEARPLLAMIRRTLHRVAPAQEAPLHAEAASLLEDSLSDPDAAFVHWRRATALDPSDGDILARALACADATGGALRQLDLLELAAAAASLPRDRARLLAQRAELLTDALNWTEEGAESWRLSLELDPNQPAVRARLEAGAAA